MGRDLENGGIDGSTSTPDLEVEAPRTKKSKKEMAAADAVGELNKTISKALNQDASSEHNRDTHQLVAKAKATEHEAAAAAIKQQTLQVQNTDLREFIKMDTDQLGPDGARLKQNAVNKLAANLGII